MREPEIVLPRLRKATIRYLSLYTSSDEITVDFDRSVLCLVGANGLGKSTFIAAINYGLTGRVPSDRFRSVEEFFVDSRDFSSRFFSGRITERDRDQAEIELEFSIGNTGFRITRGFFETDELRALHLDSDDVHPELSGLESPVALQTSYQQAIVEASGLSTFEQFVFLQLFVFTFDERRRVVFWDQKVMDQVVFLAFGLNPEEAHQADTLTRRIEKLDSNGRNYRYQATQARARKRELVETTSREAPGTSVNESVLDQYVNLTDREPSAIEDEERTKIALNDAELELMERSARLQSFQHDYARAFSLRGESLSLKFQPLISRSLSDSQCAVCSTRSDQVATSILQKIDSGLCPLCGSETTRSDLWEDISDLERLDGLIASSQGELSEYQSKVSRSRDEHTNAQGVLRAIRAQLARLEIEHGRIQIALAERSGGNTALEELTKRYEERIVDLDGSADEAYAQRDEVKEQLKKLQERVTELYVEAEREFVPRFRELATLFLGLDLDIRLDAKAGSWIGLYLEIDNTSRREAHQLSESQRFFVDIALRMALANYLSRGIGAASMLIDTPEGSLDIAYESRAGDMFARFAEAGHRVIMTANVNSSQLLIRLAQRCGHDGMRLTRMIEWTQLSEVQREEEHLFQSAFARIEEALSGTGT